MKNTNFIQNIKGAIILIFLLIQTNLIGQIYESISVPESNTLIIDNVDNPNFVILDVRTPGEYNPEHLEGAIIRNYYDSDFSDQLDALDKTKKYLIHCKSGNRSSSALALMENLNFDEVYNMLGGITQWNAQSLPTTNAFAPRIMFVSENVFPNQNINIGTTETIEITLTNRANSTLSFISMSAIDNPEFSTDFNLSTTLSGAEDYTFHIDYTPTDNNTDVLYFTIESNDVTVDVTIERTGVEVVSIKDLSNYQIGIYPNPTSECINFHNYNTERSTISIINTLGQIVFNDDHFLGEMIDVSSFSPGSYHVIIKTQNTLETKVIIIK